IRAVLGGLAAVDVALADGGRIPGKVVGGTRSLDALLLRLLRRIRLQRATGGGQHQRGQDCRSSCRDTHALTSFTMETYPFDLARGFRVLAAAAAFSALCAHADLPFKTAQV